MARITQAQQEAKRQADNAAYMAAFVASYSARLLKLMYTVPRISAYRVEALDNDYYHFTLQWEKQFTFPAVFREPDAWALLHDFEEAERMIDDWRTAEEHAALLAHRVALARSRYDSAMASLSVEDRLLLDLI
jgi:hypothetical protein